MRFHFASSADNVTIRKIRIAATETNYVIINGLEYYLRFVSCAMKDERKMLEALNTNKSQAPGSALDRACTWYIIGFQRC